jgi:hypothetical protein
LRFAVRTPMPTASPSATTRAARVGAQIGRLDRGNHVRPVTPEAAATPRGPQGSGASRSRRRSGKCARAFHLDPRHSPQRAGRRRARTRLRAASVPRRRQRRRAWDPPCRRSRSPQLLHLEHLQR